MYGREGLKFGIVAARRDRDLRQRRASRTASGVCVWVGSSGAEVESSERSWLGLLPEEEDVVDGGEDRRLRAGSELPQTMMGVLGIGVEDIVSRK